MSYIFGIFFYICYFYLQIILAFGNYMNSAKRGAVYGFKLQSLDMVSGALFRIWYYTVEPLLRGHPDKRPPLLERPLDNVNLNINVLVSTPDERPPLLKGHFSDAKWLASQEGFHCTSVNLRS